MKINTSLKVKFNDDFKPTMNSEFVEGTALIAYVDENRNFTDIPEESFDAAEYSLPLIPIVGNWIGDKKNFGGHDVTFEIRAGELILKDNTIPYGVVKENHNAQWVEIEENGETHKYKQVDVVLWAGRYQEPINKIIEDGVNQSMEINVNEYEEKENGYVKITKFEYSALCILGKDMDEYGNKGEDNVEPCFESASITVNNKFSMNETFKANFEALKSALNDNSVEPEPEPEPEQNNDDVKPEEFNNDGFEPNEPDVNVEPEVESKSKSKFMLNSEKREALKEGIPRQESTEEVNFYYWVMDFDDEYVYFEEERYDNDGWERNYFRCSYTVSENNEITVNVDSKEEIVQKWLTKSDAEALETQVMSLKDEVKELKTEIESYKLNLNEKDSKIAELEIYKNDVEKQIKEARVEEIISDFSDELKDVDEFEKLKDKAMEMDIEKLTEKLYALVGKVNKAKKIKKDKKSNFSKVMPIEVNEDDKKDNNDLSNHYGEASRYFNKK